MVDFQVPCIYYYYTMIHLYYQVKYEVCVLDNSTNKVSDS